MRRLSSTQKRIRKDRHKRQVSKVYKVVPLGFLKKCDSGGDQEFINFLEDCSTYPDATNVRIFRSGKLEVLATSCM